VTDREGFLAAAIFAADFLAADFWAADFWDACFLFLRGGFPVQLNEAFNCYSFVKTVSTFNIFFFDAITEPIHRLKYLVRQKKFTSAS